MPPSAPTLLSALALVAAYQQAVAPVAAAAPCRPVASPAQPTIDPATLPALTGRVVDTADLLPAADEERLSDLSARLEQRTTDQFVVVTVPSLAGATIDDFALALGQHWGVGQRGRDNGVLLIVAAADRQVRIEVGYGLEPILTDARAAEIIEEQLLPAFRQGNFRQGISEGAEAIAGTLTANAGAARIGAC